MICPFCLHKKTDVYNSRQTKKTNQIWRRRRCQSCNKTFTTHESVDPNTVLFVQKLKKRLPFSQPKLLLSLLKAMDHKTNSGKPVLYIYEVIINNLYTFAAKNNQTIPVDELVGHVADTLKLYDTTAYVKYLSYHNSSLNAVSLRRALKRTK